jgi:predicted Zn finger-like uncharacterized protein
MSSVRLRRLAADYSKLQDYARRHPRVRLVHAEGDPPERYQIEYRIRSLRMVGGELQPVLSHLVEVTLPRNYPRMPPQCRMLSPVFHPNIAPHAICVGDHWSAGEPLQSIITRIGEMLAYQSYNVKSPLNGEAARWVEVNKEKVPLDRVSLLVDEGREELCGATASAADPMHPPAPSPTNNATQHFGTEHQSITGSTTAAPARAATPAESIQVACPGCKAIYRVSGEFAGRKVRCKKCGESFLCELAGPTSSAGEKAIDS